MKICVVPGDGIGPEIIAQALRVMDVLKQDGLKFETEQALLGGCAVDATGTPYPEATQKLARAADAVLFGRPRGPGSHPGPDRREPGAVPCGEERALAAGEVDLF